MQKSHEEAVEDSRDVLLRAISPFFFFFFFFFFFAWLVVLLHLGTPTLRSRDF